MIQKTSSTETVVSIQYLRAIAAGLVLLEHIGKKSAQVGDDLLSSLGFGYTGVDIFFVISGFIICHMLEPSHRASSSPTDFMLRRVARIIPIYWLLTLLALAAFIISPEDVNSSGGTTVIWQSFLLIPSEGHRFLIANGWTLSYEMFFYGIFCLSFLTTSSRISFALPAIVLILIASTSLTGVTKGYFINNPLILEFVFGMLVYALYKRSEFRGFSVEGVVLLILGAAGLVLQKYTAQMFPDMRFLTAGVPSFLVVYGAVLNEGLLRRFEFEWLGKLGDSSYSMYLLHPFPLKAFGLVFSKLGFASFGFVFELAYWSFVAAFCLGSGYIFYLYVETPLNKFSRSAIKSRRARTARAAA